MEYGGKGCHLWAKSPRTSSHLDGSSYCYCRRASLTATETNTEHSIWYYCLKVTVVYTGPLPSWKIQQILAETNTYSGYEFAFPTHRVTVSATIPWFAEWFDPLTWDLIWHHHLRSRDPLYSKGRAAMGKSCHIVHHSEPAGLKVVAKMPAWKWHSTRRVHPTPYPLTPQMSINSKAMITVHGISNR